MVDFMIKSQDGKSVSELINEELNRQFCEISNCPVTDGEPLWDEEVDVLSCLRSFVKEIRGGL